MTFLRPHSWWVRGRTRIWTPSGCAFSVAHGCFSALMFISTGLVCPWHLRGLLVPQPRGGACVPAPENRFPVLGMAAAVHSRVLPSSCWWPATHKSLLSSCIRTETQFVNTLFVEMFCVLIGLFSSQLMPYSYLYLYDPFSLSPHQVSVFLLQLHPFSACLNMKLSNGGGICLTTSYFKNAFPENFDTCSLEKSIS